MADVPIYQQNFTAGTPSFHADSVYDPILTADADDTNYPEIRYAEGLVINGSGHVDSGHSYNYFLSQLRFGDEVDFPNEPISVPEGYIQCRYKPNATSLSAGGGDADILYVYRNGGFNGDLAFSIAREGSNNTLLIEAWNSANTDSASGTPSFTFTAGTEYLFRVEFKVGTGGYFRLLINGATVFEDLTFEPWFDGASGDEIETLQFGGWALLGELWDIEIGTFSETIQAYAFGRGAAADDKAKVVSDLTVLMNLDGLGRTVNEPNTLYLAGNLIVTGTTTFTGDVVTSSPETLMNSMVTTGSELVLDSNGNIVFVNGS